jgi:hypothetical protein
VASGGRVSGSEMSVLGLDEPVKNPIRGSSCPECSQTVASNEIQFTRLFPCPRCGKPICVPHVYRIALFFTALIPSLGVPYLLGVRNAIVLLVVALAGMMPIVLGALALTVRATLPLKLQPYDPEDGWSTLPREAPTAIGTQTMGQRYLCSIRRDSIWPLV